MRKARGKLKMDPGVEAALLALGHPPRRRWAWHIDSESFAVEIIDLEGDGFFAPHGTTYAMPTRALALDCAINDLRQRRASINWAIRKATDDQRRAKASGVSVSEGSER